METAEEAAAVAVDAAKDEATKCGGEQETKYGAVAGDAIEGEDEGRYE